MLSKITIYLTILLLALLTSACSRTMSYEKMVEFINNPENGLVQKKSINGIDFKLTYQPTDLLVFNELRGNDTISEEQLNETRMKYLGQHYFILSVSSGGKEILSNASNRQSFSIMVNQLSFGMGSKVLLTTDERDTLNLLDFQSPRYFGMAESTDILFAFRKNMVNTKSLLFTLSEFGLKTGDLRFVFDTENINAVLNEKIKFITH